MELFITSKKLSDIFNALLNLLWPLRCAACNTVLKQLPVGELDEGFCESCQLSVDRIGPAACSRCRLPFESGLEDHLCGLCLKQPPPFSQIICEYQYGGALADAISRFKYEPAPWLSVFFGQLITVDCVHWPQVDMVVPVPLYKKRLRKRGFNQSALIGSAIAKQLKIPFRTNLLLKKRETPNQAGLSRKDRLTTLKGAFWVKNPSKIKKAKILLVDDVITTTATSRETAKTLIKAGAKQVVVVAVARAPYGV